MSKAIRIAIDAMGGDDAPLMTVEGVEEARVLYPETQFLLFGNENMLKPLVSRYPGLLKSAEIVHTEDEVLADDKPSQVLRRGRQSSMGLSITAVKDGNADVAVSAGNTGGLMALAKFILRTMPGIERPALVSPIPTLRGESVMLDLGANVECSASNLVQFAIMGSAYARTVLGLSRPSVGLLNVGVEELKGKDFIKDAAEVLRASASLNMEFQGFVEGNDICGGEVDVIATDGFTGNVALKTTEGTAKLIAKLLERAFKSSVFAKLGYGFASSGIKSLREHLDPNSHNGGVFLGLNGLVVKSHGGANALGFRTAIATGIDMARFDLIRLITEDLANITDSNSGSEGEDALVEAAGE